MNLLSQPVPLAAGDARFQVDDARVNPGRRDLPKRVSPDILVVDPARNGTVAFLGNLHVTLSVQAVRLMKPRQTRRRQDLINPAPRHHVAAQEKMQGCLGASL